MRKMETPLFVPKVQELAESDHNYCQLKADNEKLYEPCQCQSWPNKQRNFSIYCRYICGTVSTQENFEQQSIYFQFSKQLFKSFLFISDDCHSSPPHTNSDSLASDGVLFPGSLPTPTGASIHQSMALPSLFPFSKHCFRPFLVGQNCHICLRSGPKGPYGQPDRKIYAFFTPCIRRLL